MRLIARARRRTQDERGFSLILTVVVLAVVTVMVFASIDAVTGGAGTTRSDLDQKRALLGAYAGLSAYTQALANNPNYWTGCPTKSSVTVPGSTDDNSIETYSYKQLVATSAPSNDNTSCDSSNPVATEVESNDAASGSFRVKFTGTSQPASGNASATYTRSIVAQFAPNRFLNYVYFTNYEELDPVAENPSNPDYADCDTYLWSSPARMPSLCQGIEFAPGDEVNGPLHSNDEIEYCGGTTFGESSTDVEQAYSFNADGGTGCGGAVNFVGKEETNALANGWSVLQLPPSDEQLLQIADGGNSSNNNGCYTNAGCVFTGPTTIVFSVVSGVGKMTVTNASLAGSPVTYSTATQPSNGVIYVNTGTGACAAYTPSGTDYTPSDNVGCGDATVSGAYNSSLTIGTAGDIIINGSLTTSLSSTALLGLIADDFVRIAHPVGSGCGSNTSNGIYSSLTSPTIDAAILSIDHSFIVDNYKCGAALGTLTVNGVIAQDYRGGVGQENSGTIVHGYTKAYTYDTRFQSLSPPYFLNPVDAGWQVQRITECDSSTSC
jgi:Tfp pilus assembly protein PilX